MLKLKKVLASVLALAMSIGLSAGVSAQPKNAYAPFTPPAGYTGEIKYNSAGVPLLGENYPVSSSSAGSISPFYTHYPKEGYVTYINGRVIPCPDYPIESLFTISVDGSYSCVAFAKYVYKYLWGSYTYGTTTGMKTTSSETTAKNVLRSLNRGARITGYDSYGNQRHTMILLNTDSSYVYVYHSNYSTTENQVNITRFTYKEFAGIFAQIQGYNPG